MNIDGMLERQQAASMLVWQFGLRIAGLTNIAAIGSVRRALDTYQMYLQRSAAYVQDARITDPPEQWIDTYVDTMSECIEKSWQDSRNNLQILLLIQDEALIWVLKIQRTLSAGG